PSAAKAALAGGFIAGLKPCSTLAAQPPTRIKRREKLLCCCYRHSQSRACMKYLYEELPALEVAGRKMMGRVLFSALVVAAALVGAFAGLLIVYSTDLPEVSELENYRPSAVTELYDDKGREIGSFAIQRSMLVRYDDRPKGLRDALLSSEDKEFEKHWGVNIWRVLGAMYRDLSSHQKAQGASTLTMQLSRNLFLSPERTLSRKLQETMLAIQIERRFTKQQIFAMYCNQVYLGHGMY